jgi:hypothetical protein
MLKPGFFTNDALAEVAPIGRLLFAGLWCIADREGRLEDRPARIRAEVLPYERDVDVPALLDELAARGFLVRYGANGRRYIQITTFTRHQSPHVREPASTIPAPDEAESCTDLSNDEHRASTGPAPDETGARHPPSPAEYGIRNTESESESVTNMAISQSPWAGTPPRKASKNGYDPAFEAWWSTYPRHDGKLPASLAYRDRLKAGRSPSELAEAARHFAGHHEAAATPTEKIPHGSTWLHQHRDEEWERGPPDADRVVAPQRNGAVPKLAETAAGLRQLKHLREQNGDKRTSFFDLATAGVGLPDAGHPSADPRALPRPPDGPPLA